MSKALESSDIVEMAMSLVCVLDKDVVKEILLGEQYIEADIAAFIEYCET